MIIVKEKKNISLKESDSLEDVIGVGGYKAISIDGNKFLEYPILFYKEFGEAEIRRGRGTYSHDSIVVFAPNKNKVIIDFAVSDIKYFSIQPQGVSITFVLKDSTRIKLHK